MAVKPINFELHEERLTYLDARIARFKAELKKAQEGLLNDIKGLKMLTLGHASEREFGLWNALDTALFSFNMETHPVTRNAKAYMDKSRNLINKFEELMALHNIELYQGQLHGDRKLFEDLIDKAIYDDLLMMYKQLINDTKEYLNAEKEERKAPSVISHTAKEDEELMIKWFEYFDQLLVEVMTKNRLVFEDLTISKFGSFAGSIKSNMMLQKTEINQELYERWIFETKNKINRLLAKKKTLLEGTNSPTHISETA